MVNEEGGEEGREEDEEEEEEEKEEEEKEEKEEEGWSYIFIFFVLPRAFRLNSVLRISIIEDTTSP